jgi:hypothetical protein
MRSVIALVGAALIAAGGCGQTPSPSAPTAVSAQAAGTLDYYDDYPAPTPDPYPLPPPPEPPAPTPSGPVTLVVTPVYGATAGGAAVTITGGGFVAGTTVTFGATPVPATIVDPTTLTVVAPPGSSGWVDVVVTIPGGSTLTLPGGFTYADDAAPDTTPTITITPSGNTPRAVVVAAGGRVRFVNNDARPHALSSDPHPIHTDCPEINSAGLLVPGGSGTTGALMTPRTCGIHDHNDPGNAAWMSRIVIR